MFFKEFFCYLQSRYVKAVTEITGWGCHTRPTIENRLKKSVPNCPSHIFFGPDRPVKICNIRVER